MVRIESLLVQIGIQWLENVEDGLANEPGSDLEAKLLREYERRVEEEDTKATERIMTSIQSKGIS